MKTFSKMPFDQQVEAMQLIVNIQTMKSKIHDRKFEFHEFESNTLNELRKIQDDTINEWNITIKN